ncbi:hypothetical protein LSH36_127g06061 [Paralvinella palmiformis]|uniref:Uncharacterized protein n=1 Tax=Paralvinella palmiformis TaxID=53620 RepID=A0AAD9N876_9ANNE|nr:hypothetical protein LSH36_127g06061 [Paralvinella palmiformis]
MMIAKLLVAIIAVSLGALSQLECDDEILITSKRVALTTTRAKLFQFLSDMRNFKRWYSRVTQCEPTDMAPVSIGKHYFMSYYIPLCGEQSYSAMISGYESPKYLSFIMDDWCQSRVELSAEKYYNSIYPTSLTLSIYSRNKSFLMRVCSV